MNGIINLLKPPGMSSHQAVSFARKQLGIKKIGHTGTLDPGASGVLPLVVGSATRLSDYVMEHEKTYIAELTLGISTDTQDAGGATVELNTNFSIGLLQFAEAAAEFQGNIWQTPPMASAVKVRGKRLYQWKRENIAVPRKPRRVQVYSINIHRIWNGEGDTLRFGSRILLKVVCSKGTYLRTICHDLGAKLGVGGHMSFLARIQSGPFSTRDAYTLEDIQSLVKQNNLKFLLPMQKGLPDWIQVKVNPLAEERIRHGNFILPGDLIDVPTALTVGDQVVLLGIEGDVLALAEIKRTDRLICQPFRVFVGG
ncbi:MAG: tRNA pseudouridine(55) synthase TruB [Firmicutes bacterium]|nr:tRNA pseudouridine(55) synthase TruB [Bacillota bacterium]